MEDWFVHIKSGDRILIVGDGDFSFSVALSNNINARGLQNEIHLTASVFDCHDDLLKMYPTTVSNNINSLLK
jgi:hypothetical protein